MSDPARKLVFEVLKCDVEARPKHAPTIVDIARYASRIDRSKDVLRVWFVAEAADDVEACAVAERACCAGIDWLVVRGPTVLLSIGASSAQLDVLEQMFRSR